MINVPVILFRELNLGEKSGGKETGKKDQEDYSTFPHEIWLEFYLGIFFPPSGSFWVRLLPELLTGSYDLEISDNEIMKCSGIENSWNF